MDTMSLQPQPKISHSRSIMSKIRLDWGHWFYGLAGAVIGGGSTSIVASLASMGIAPTQFNLDYRIGNTLKMFATCFIVNGAISMFLWLKQQPLPTIEESDP